VDLVGPLPASEDGYLYILTMVDQTTCWLEAVPLKNISASVCVETFLSSWAARFGVPETITSDRDTHFSSAAWAAFCSKLGTRHFMTTAYHPQANGLVERTHQQLKDALRARQAGVDWPAHLPWVLLGLQAAPKEVSGLSSMEAVFGQPLVMPGELSPTVETSPTDLQESLASETPPVTCQPRTYAEVAARPPDPRLQQAELVYVKRGGCECWLRTGECWLRTLNVLPDSAVLTVLFCLSCLFALSWLFSSV
jgi:transposase InsO family protein